MEEIRSFIAIELPESLRAELGQVEAKLKPAARDNIRWVEPNGIHLTLKFLGGILADSIPEIMLVMEEAATIVPPFELKVGGLGAFPNLKRVQVTWVGVSGEIDKLRRLQQGIESGLVQLGFPPEGRAFTAHLTLGRTRNEAPSEWRLKFGQLIAETKFEATSKVQVSELSLMRSQLTRAGAIYTRLGAVKLKGLTDK